MTQYVEHEKRDHRDRGTIQEIERERKKSEGKIKPRDTMWRENKTRRSIQEESGTT